MHTYICLCTHGYMPTSTLTQAHTFMQCLPNGRAEIYWGDWVTQDVCTGGYLYNECSWSPSTKLVATLVTRISFLSLGCMQAGTFRRGEAKKQASQPHARLARLARQRPGSPTTGPATRPPQVWAGVVTGHTNTRNSIGLFENLKYTWFVIIIVLE